MFSLPFQCVIQFSQSRNDVNFRIGFDPTHAPQWLSPNYHITFSVTSISMTNGNPGKNERTHTLHHNANTNDQNVQQSGNTTLFRSSCRSLFSITPVVIQTEHRSRPQPGTSRKRSIRIGSRSDGDPNQAGSRHAGRAGLVSGSAGNYPGSSVRR